MTEHWSIKTATDRARLPKRQEPYWISLGSCRALGYRTGVARGKRAVSDTWVARWRERGGGKKHFCSLGEQPDFTAAKEAAEAWFLRIGSGVKRTPNRGTVREALAAYIRHLRSDGRRRTAKETLSRFQLTCAKKSEFGDMKLEAVAREDVTAWRNRLRKGREPRSVNRQVRAVVAALNYAVGEAGHIGNPKAWKLKQFTDDGEESTPVFLTQQQRDRLIAAASPALKPFLIGLNHTGCRPIELARAVVADFNPQARTLSVRHYKGKGAKLRNRAVALSMEAVLFFREQSRDKLPAAPLITGIKGKHWTADRWCHWVQKAIADVDKAAKQPAQRMPAGVSAYSFRHTRISELLQLYGIDPLTVAMQTGTSTPMIQRSYFKFIPDAMLAKLDAMKPVAETA